MLIHFSNQGTTRPVCDKTRVEDAIQLSSNIDNITCLDCLRKLAKDAGRFGNGARVDRRTTYGKGRR